MSRRTLRTPFIRAYVGERRHFIRRGIVGSESRSRVRTRSVKARMPFFWPSFAISRLASAAYWSSLPPPAPKVRIRKSWSPIESSIVHGGIGVSPVMVNSNGSLLGSLFATSIQALIPATNALRSSWRSFGHVSNRRARSSAV